MTSTDEFSTYAPFFYGELAKLNKTDFVNVWRDDKQAILSTNPIRTDTADNYSYDKKQIFFIKDISLWKVMNLDISAGSIPKSWGAEGEKELQSMPIDSDKDGVADRVETCSGAEQYNSRCVKTDPNNRDTNGNGWWDGIEEDMK